MNDESGAATSDARVAGLVLASGMSTRFGHDNKLLALIHGVPVVRRTAQAYCDARLQSVHVVIGHGAEQVAAALGDLPVQIIVNPSYREGQSQALVRGIGALPESVEAAVVGVGDQPLLSGVVIRELVEAQRESGAPIVAPRYGGRPGNPVLFHRSLFPELSQVRGDEGGRSVIRQQESRVLWLDIADQAAGADVDTADDLSRLEHE